MWEDSVMSINLQGIPVRNEPGRATLIDRDDIDFIEAKGDDS